MKFLVADAAESAWYTAGLIVGFGFAGTLLTIGFVFVHHRMKTRRPSTATIREPIEHVEPGARFEAWQRALAELIDAYREVERRGLDLPAVAFGTSWGR